MKTVLLETFGTHEPLEKLDYESTIEHMLDTIRDYYYELVPKKPMEETKTNEANTTNTAKEEEN